MATRQPWDRQQGPDGKEEPALWFERFEQYRLLGPNRSMLAVYRADRQARAAKRREKARKGAIKSVPGAWRERAREWRWEERAAAWDAHVATEARLAREAEERRLRDEARAVRRSLLNAGNNLLAKTMMVYLGAQSATPDAQTVLRLLGAIEKFNKDSRSEYGDVPAQDVNVRGVLGSVQITADDMAQARDAIQRFEEELTGGRITEDDTPANHISSD